MIPEDELDNFGIFIDCLSTRLIERLAPGTSKASKKRVAKGRKNEANTLIEHAGGIENDNQEAADLSDFVEYLAKEIFTELPDDLRTISYAIIQDNIDTAEKYALPLDNEILSTILKTLPSSISDSLVSYDFIQDASDLDRFLDPIFTNYVSTATAAPPEYTPELTASKPSGCEICEREHVPLTYHHLIPRQIHSKAVKRGWHKEWQLNKVCWLCRACHSHIHKIASNEELAREYYDVELLLQREDVQKFASWVGRVRWKAR